MTIRADLHTMDARACIRAQAVGVKSSDFSCRKMGSACNAVGEVNHAGTQPPAIYALRHCEMLVVCTCTSILTFRCDIKVGVSLWEAPGSAIDGVAEGEGSFATIRRRYEKGMTRHEEWRRTR
jgi:hypothetical protein